MNKIDEERLSANIMLRTFMLQGFFAWLIIVLFAAIWTINLIIKGGTPSPLIDSPWYLLLSVVSFLTIVYICLAGWAFLRSKSYTEELSSEDFRYTNMLLKKHIDERYESESRGKT